MKVDRIKYLATMAARSKSLVNGDRGVELCAFFDAALEQAKDAEKQKGADKYLAELCERARTERLKGFEGEAVRELNALRVTAVDNFLLASSNALTFFDTVNLQPDEAPWIENSTRQEMSIRYIGQDGKPKSMNVQKNNAHTRVDLAILSTDRYEYPIVDLYTGDAKSPALANIDMEYDFRQRIDAILWPLVKGQIGAFGLTGAKASRVYVPHSSIATANLPTSNLLTPTDTGAATTWRKSCLDAIIDYCASWGSNAFRDGELKPEVIYIPSSDVKGWLDNITISSVENSLTRQIFESGWVVSYGGTTFTLVGDSTLDPDDGRAYVKLNKSIGEYFTKTSLDTTVTNTYPQQNREDVSMSKVYGAGLPSPKKVNLCAVQYRTAAS